MKFSLSALTAAVLITTATLASAQNVAIVNGKAVPSARLAVLEHHTELGAGYRIALKDLELRGAGNLQCGVGFDLVDAQGDVQFLGGSVAGL